MGVQLNQRKIEFLSVIGSLSRGEGGTGHPRQCSPDHEVWIPGRESSLGRRTSPPLRRGVTKTPGMGGSDRVHYDCTRSLWG